MYTVPPFDEKGFQKKKVLFSEMLIETDVLNKKPRSRYGIFY